MVQAVCILLPIFNVKMSLSLILLNNGDATSFNNALYKTNIRGIFSAAAEVHQLFKVKFL